MPSTIWTACAGGSEPRRLEVDAWRVVEAQHLISTRKLVSSDAEQVLLEQLIDGVKPPEPSGGRLHYLLFTPFRYPPLRHGSRFGRRWERGLWYGSERLSTAFAEVAYYRLLFLDGTSAAIEPLVTPLTAFRAALRTPHGEDLTRAPFSAHTAAVSDPGSYAASQPLGTAMREAGIHAFRFTSARDPAGGVNVAAFEPAVFGRRQPRTLQTWHSTATRAQVELQRRDYFERASFAFERSQFEVGGRLPAPALGHRGAAAG
jgi:hypothetical protein